MNRVTRVIVSIGLPLLWFLGGQTFAADWLQQMGPDRNGIIPADVAGKLAESFPGQKPPVLWQANVGFGTAPVVVKEGRVFTFGLFRSGVTPNQLADPKSAPTFNEIREMTFGEKPAPAQVMSRDLPDTPAFEENHFCFRGDEYASCLEAATGKTIWAMKLTDFGLAYANHAAWDMASPLLAQGKLYLHSPVGRLYCLDAANGALLWQRNLFECQMFRWTEKQGNACGPLAFGETILVSYTGRVGTNYTSPAGTTCTVIASFDAATGKTRWVTKSPYESFRPMNTRLGWAEINGQLTVLVPGGTGTVGIDPASGKIRWSHAMPREKDVWAPYPAYAPVAWQNFVLDDSSVAHDDRPSRTWCLQIVNNVPNLLWENHDFVPHTEIFKSNLIARDGKFYGFDAHGIWDTPGKPSDQRGPNLAPGRNFRGSAVGQFQCRDIATGKLLWSTNAFEPPEVNPLKWPGEWNPTLFIMAGDRLIVQNEWGLWIAHMKPGGVAVQARWKEFRGHAGEPVMVAGKLYARQADCRDQPGNLACLDLRSNTRGAAPGAR